MSLNLTLSSPTSNFNLRQTPTWLTKAVSGKSSKDIKEQYLQWVEEYCFKTYPEDSEYSILLKRVEYLEHENQLLNWLLNNPSHTWNFI